MVAVENSKTSPWPITMGWLHPSPLLSLTQFPITPIWHTAEEGVVGRSIKGAPLATPLVSLSPPGKQVVPACLGLINPLLLFQTHLLYNMHTAHSTYPYTADITDY